MSVPRHYRCVQVFVTLSNQWTGGTTQPSLDSNDETLCKNQIQINKTRAFLHSRLPLKPEALFRQ